MSLPPGWPLELGPGAALAKSLQVSGLPAPPGLSSGGTAICDVGHTAPLSDNAGCGISKPMLRGCILSM